MHYGPVMIDIQGTELTELEKELIKHPSVGGILLFTRNYKNLNQLKDLVRDLRLISRRPLLIAVDHEGGRVWRFEEGFTKLPPVRQFGIVYDHNPKQAFQMAKDAASVMATELLDCGIDISLAPVLDLDKGISNVIGDRAFHGEPNAVASIAGAFVEGMKNAGMAATGKHFPGHGSCKPDTHFFKAEDNRAFDVIWGEDLVPFRKLSEELKAVMPAHVFYPEVDSMPAGFSKIWLQDILRDKIGFKGAVISDCLSMKGAALEGDMVMRAHLALDAGCDMVIMAQQERKELLWILQKLDRETSKESYQRLAALQKKGVRVPMGKAVVAG